MPIQKLTKSNVDKIPLTPQGQVLYFDTELKGFGLCVGKTSKTYIVQGYVDRRRIRYTIGRHGVFTPDQARNEARLHLADMARGFDPNEKQKESYANKMTVSQALEEYIADRKSLRDISAEGYRSHIRLYLSDWADRPLSSITKAEILERHSKVGKTRGPCAANKSMRVMRQIFNYAHAKYGNIPDNPCRYLTLLKAWFPVERRRTYIKPHDLAKWHFGVQQIVNPTIRDFLLLLLFTGLRKSEAIKLRWEHIDMEGRVMTIPQTKNGDPHSLPLSDYLYEFFHRRKMATGLSPWVFPGHGDDGHMTEPKKSVRFVTDLTGVEYTLHDLRRSFITIAESLDLPYSALKRLLNHRSGDITSSYIMSDAERLREPMERVSRKICELIYAEHHQGGNGSISFPVRRAMWPKETSTPIKT